MSVQSSELGSPPPPPQASVATPPLGYKGASHTRLRGREPNSDDWTVDRHSGSLYKVYCVTEEKLRG
jgi:hypothetical protein